MCNNSLIRGKFMMIHVLQKQKAISMNHVGIDYSVRDKPSIAAVVSD